MFQSDILKGTEPNSNLNPNSILPQFKLPDPVYV